VIGNHVTICDGVQLGECCIIGDFAIVGKVPILAAGSAASDTVDGPAQLGRDCSVGSHAVLMAGSHLGNRVILGDGAFVRERCDISDDVVIGHAVTVENDTRVGARTKIQAGAYITAHMLVESDVFIAPMVVTTNDNFMGRTERARVEMRGPTIRRGARVGGGAHILPGIEIGEESFVATAAVVTRDVAPRSVVMGNPARVVRTVPPEELLTGI
jgi:acetyltransferase-like isoleucine patch superfamily enzyme